MVVAGLYQATRQRIEALVSSGVGAECTSVPTCPAWTVCDVMAHLAAVADDWARGRLTGLPTDDETAAQIARFAGHDLAGLLAAWSRAEAVHPESA